jgi:uncharacterized protein (DUF885 family)
MIEPALTSPVRALADDVFAYRLERDAFLRVRRGLPVEHLRVESDSAWAEDAVFARTTLARLAATEPVDEDDRLTTGFLEHVLSGWVDRAEHIQLGFTVTPYSAFFLGMGLQQVFAGYAGSAAGYLALVGDHRDQIVELRARLLRQRDAGVLVPQPALPGVRESLSRTRAAAGALLVASAPNGARDQVERLVDREVLPAFDRLLESLDENYASQAPTEVGLARCPGGEDYYRSLVRQHTASNLTPEQVHELGLAQVDDLAEQMGKVRADLGFAGSEADFHAQLATDSRLFASEPAQVEALFLRHMAAIEPLIGRWFSRLPEAEYGVKRLDPEHEAGMTYGYYEPPTPQEPVGRYRWNGANLEQKSLLTYAALIFHELAPGHHFHLARQAENASLPDVRRESMDIGAFNEGWAEYAAGLGWEMGLYDDPFDRYGRLVHERFTAQRLVVDTGLNLFGWSLERAAAFMKANTTESDGQIATEVLRYSTDLPAQALAYRAGFLELTRIRAKAERALGAGFDVRDFHEQILGPGTLPFPVIEGHVDRWVAGRA